MNTVKSLPDIFAAIRLAGVPDRFTHEFLKQLGFTSSSDRAVIPVLKALRFLDDSSVPTDRYKRFRDPAIAGAVLAEAMRDAYADVFTVNQKANEQGAAALAGVFKRISGKSDPVSRKMATTFKALTDLADWTAAAAAPPATTDEPEDPPPPPVSPPAGSGSGSVSLPTLHHDIHVHLPTTTDVKVYDAIFRSLREHLG
jgi:hypothetical protein